MGYNVSITLSTMLKLAGKPTLLGVCEADKGGTPVPLQGYFLMLLI